MLRLISVSEISQDTGHYQTTWVWSKITLSLTVMHHTESSIVSMGNPVVAVQQLSVIPQKLGIL